MGKNNKQIITDALNNALYLISEEYQSLLDDDLKQNYNKVIEELNNSLQLLKRA